ncbi:unnamed protein product [Arctogadus glacialis]
MNGAVIWGNSVPHLGAGPWRSAFPSPAHFGNRCPGGGASGVSDRCFYCKPVLHRGCVHTCTPDRQT